MFKFPFFKSPKKMVFARVQTPFAHVQKIAPGAKCSSSKKKKILLGAGFLHEGKPLAQVQKLHVCECSSFLFSTSLFSPRPDVKDSRGAEGKGKPARKEGRISDAPGASPNGSFYKHRFHYLVER
jgi:hypothetical protein